MAHQNKFHVEKAKKREAEAKQRKMKELAIYLSIVLGGLAIAGGLVAFSTSKEYEEQSKIYARSAPDYSTMEAVQSADETNTATEGVVDLDEFAELSVATITDSFASIRDVLGDSLYLSLINGMTTDYFRDSMEYDYADFNNQVDDMLIEAQYIEQLYGRYQIDHPGELETFTGCTTGEKCDMKIFIDRYTTGELKEYLDSAHQKWESLVYYERSQQEVDDSYLEMYYQDEVVANFDYIDKYDVSFIVLNSEQFAKNFDELQEAYDRGYIPETRLTNYTDVKARDNLTIVPSRESLDQFPLYRDINFYDGTFADLAADTIQQFFVQDVMDSAQYLGGSELATNSDALEDAVRQLTGDGNTLSGSSIRITNEDGEEVYQEGEPEASTDETQKDVFNLDTSQIENWHVTQVSLTNRNENDILFILWRINRIEHTLDIPDLNSVRDDLELKAKTALAQEKLSAVIYAELNQLSDEEVEEFTDNLWGEHTVESDSTANADNTDISSDNSTDSTESTNASNETQSESLENTETTNELGGNTNETQEVP